VSFELLEQVFTGPFAWNLSRNHETIARARRAAGPGPAAFFDSGFRGRRCGLGDGAERELLRPLESNRKRLTILARWRAEKKKPREPAVGDH